LKSRVPRRMHDAIDSAGRLALAFALAGVPAHTASRIAPADSFDIYVVGVRIAELIVTDHGGSRSYTIRKKDLASNQWRAPVTAGEREAARDTAFLPVWGPLKHLIALMPSLRDIRWSSLRAVGMPDANTIYVRHNELHENVNRRTVSAVRWIQRDATNPLDFVFTNDDKLVAAIDASNDIVLVRRGYERFTTVSRWRDAKMSQPKYGYRELPQAMVPMSDGVKLATLVYLPRGDISGPFPVILVRSPYGIGGQIGDYWPYATRGYALVFQAARGTSYLDPKHRSEGAWEPMVQEPKDGADALAWITRQPWSNGKICMAGASYVGYTQWAATMAGNPALKCIVPESSMGTALGDPPGGAFGEGGAYYIFWMLNQPILPNRTWTDILHYRPLRDLDRFATGKDLRQWKTLLDHPHNDDYWKRQDWYNAKVPRDFGSLQISGWFDDDFAGTESNWALTQRTDTAPRHLVIGPWRHGTNHDRALNGFSFGPDALRDDFWLLKLQTYDHFLKEIDNGIPKSKVDYFVLGANEWKSASQWPPVESRPQTWYFHSNGDAQRLMTSGSLSKSPPTGAEPPDRYVYDPNNPPPNWMSWDQMKQFEDVQSFPYDFKDIEARPDVVKFTSAPLEQDLTIAGNVMLVLYASTDVRDTDWWVHVSDVDSTGQSVRLTMAVMRARFRDGDDTVHHVFGSNYEHETLLSGDPSDVVRYDISLRAIANTFKKGHRIRIAIMNALDNDAFPNSNTGKNEATVTETVIGMMAIHHSAGHASHVVLPVMPR
jgi:putative CocE/NonD family hydrolase